MNYYLSMISSTALAGIIACITESREQWFSVMSITLLAQIAANLYQILRTLETKEQTNDTE